MITTLTGSYLRGKLRLSVCKDLGSSPSITIPSKILIENNTHCHRVKGTHYAQVTLPQSAWPRLGKALGKPTTHVSQTFMLGERTSGSLRTPQEPWSLQDVDGPKPKSMSAAVESDQSPWAWRHSLGLWPYSCG